MKKTRIVLLDSHAIIHRAYHALPDFATRSGKPTGALYGVSAMLISIISELKPDYIIACYDLPKPTFRHEAFKDYKGGRKKTDSELIEQIIESREIFSAFNIPIYDKEGYEADDLLGTIAEKLKKDENTETFIASGDMDTFQLVDTDKVKIYTVIKSIKETIIYDQKSIKEKYGFDSTKIIDYKGLAGDPSDNIPGIVGIGVKTATNLIINFGNIEEIYEELKKGDEYFKENHKEGRITPRIIKLLKEGEEEALFSKELATIKRDVPIEFKLPKKEFQDGLDLSKTGEVFRKFEFRALNERLQKALGIETTKKEISESDLDESDLKEIEDLKLAVSLLNPNIAKPTLDDILNFAD